MTFTALFGPMRSAVFPVTGTNGRARCVLDVNLRVSMLVRMRGFERTFLLAFGIAWLTKGEAFLKERRRNGVFPEPELHIAHKPAVTSQAYFDRIK